MPGGPACSPDIACARHVPESEGTLFLGQESPGDRDVSGGAFSLSPLSQPGLLLACGG